MKNKWKIQLNINGVADGFCKILNNDKIGMSCEMPMRFIEDCVIGETDEEIMERDIAMYICECLNDKTVVGKILEETKNWKFAFDNVEVRYIGK